MLLSSQVAEGMNLDPFGVFQIAPNGTIFSYDRERVVIDSRQLTGDKGDTENANGLMKNKTIVATGKFKA